MTDPKQEKPALEEMPWLQDDGPRWWERVSWSIGCGLGGFRLGCLLGTLYWGYPWRPDAGFDNEILIFIQFAGSVVIGGNGLVYGAVWPGRFAAAGVLLLHAAGALTMAYLLFSPVKSSVYFPHYLSTAIALGALALLIFLVTSRLEDFRQSTQHSKSEAPSDD